MLSSWGDSGPVREIVRQQWTFSPGGATQESENYVVDLKGLRGLQLAIRPDLNSDSDAVASLRAWRLA